MKPDWPPSEAPGMPTDRRQRRNWQSDWFDVSGWTIAAVLLLGFVGPVLRLLWAVAPNDLRVAVIVVVWCVGLGFAARWMARRLRALLGRSR